MGLLYVLCKTLRVFYSLPPSLRGESPARNHTYGRSQRSSFKPIQTFIPVLDNPYTFVTQVVGARLYIVLFSYRTYLLRYELSLLISGNMSISLNMDEFTQSITFNKHFHSCNLHYDITNIRASKPTIMSSRPTDAYYQCFPLLRYQLSRGQWFSAFRSSFVLFFSSSSFPSISTF